MMIVTLTRDMRPHHANAEIVVADDTARRLVAAGDARDPRPFAPPAAPAAESPARRSYKTK